MAATIRGLRSALVLGSLVLSSGMLAGCLGGGADGSGNPGSSASVSNPSITAPVSQPATGGGVDGATLAWTAPTENVDGSPLTDLSGYVIAYGTASDALTETVTVDNPSVDRYVFDQLPTGTYYFAVRAVSASGAESELSEMVSKSIG